MDVAFGGGAVAEEGDGDGLFPAVLLLVGDADGVERVRADGDGDVDETDQELFDSTFGLRAGDEGFLGYFDFDRDSDVDDADLAAFIERFGSTLFP